MTDSNFIEIIPAGKPLILALAHHRSVQTATMGLAIVEGKPHLSLYPTKDEPFLIGPLSAKAGQKIVDGFGISVLSVRPDGKHELTDFPPLAEANAA